MSEVKPQGPADIIPPQDTIFYSVDTSLQAEPEAPQGEHEVVDSEKHAEEPHVDEPAISPQENGDSKTHGTQPPQSEDVPAVELEDASSSPADEGKNKEPAPTADSGKSKPAMLAKTTGNKSTGPPTPLVKKILNSGTFGAGAVKAAPATKPATKAVSNAASFAVHRVSSAAATLRKSVSADAPASNPTKPTPVAKAPSTGTSATGPARRASVVPSKSSAPPPLKPSMSSSTSKPPLSSSISKPPLSSSTSSKPTASTTSKPTTATRPVVSPTGSTTSVKSSSTRPRASVSEGVKKVPLAGRQSLSGATMPPTTKSAGTKPARTTGSISSIREVREDGKALEDLQAKLKEASESLSSKSEAVIELEGRVKTLKSSLEAAESEARIKQVAIDQQEQAGSTLVGELAMVKAELQKFHEEDSGALATAQEELNAAKVSVTEQTELIQNLQTQIQKLEAELLAAKENLDALKASHALTSSEVAVAAQIDRDALVKTKADLEALAAQAEILKATHKATLDDTTAMHNEYQSKAAVIETLENELAALRVDKEETVNKLSELEVEILELKESQEKAQDKHEESLSRVKVLEEELVMAVAATQQATDAVAAKEGEHLQRAATAKNVHDEELKVITNDRAKVMANLEAIKEELAASQAAYEQAKIEAQAAREDHFRQLSTAEKLHLSKQGELTEQIRKISAELEGQESLYNAKVDAAKEEYNKLLEAEFERAKNEASEAHGQDLQRLRAESRATTEQLCTAHQSTIEDMKTEHANLLDSQVKALEKRISNQTLELKAAHDDLVKAKATLEASRTEVKALKVQLDEAKAAASAEVPPDPAFVEEINRLTKELANAKDDVAATQDALKLTKQSLSEVTNNQIRELEEAAKGRAQEVMRLNAAHEEAVATLVGQKSELATKLSDLEGELATLKASASDTPASPKANGTNGTVQPTSPGVTKEELQRLHEAHNAKMHDLQAEHDKTLKTLRETLDASLSKTQELQEEVARKTMEIQYLEQEQEESSDQITRLKEDMGSLA